MMTERPTVVEDTHLTYLDGLRASGATNMFGAGAYLLDEYSELNVREAREVLLYWMASFEERCEAGEVDSYLR